MVRDWFRKGRLGTIGCLALLAAVFTGGTAYGVAQTITATDNVFSAASYTMDQGDRPPFTNAGLNSHNATASGNGPDGKPLFSSPTIGTGSTSLNGTQYLTAGSYGFICTIHPTTMIATLVVSGNGTPVARPSLSLTVQSKKLDKVASKGKLQVAVNASTKVDGASLEAKLGNASLAKVTNLSLAAGSQSVTLKLNKAAKSKLAKKSKATVSVEGTVPFGATASAKGKLK